MGSLWCESRRIIERPRRRENKAARIKEAEIELSALLTATRLQKQADSLDKGSLFSWLRQSASLFAPAPAPCSAPQTMLPTYQPLIGPQMACVWGKKTLILDLDNTLVVASEANHGDHDFIVDDFPFEGYYMHKRPGLDKFLSAVAEHFEIVVYTAGTADYAAEVLDAIDKQHVVRWQLSREHCCPIPGSPQYTKHLHRLGRPLSACIMLDDSPELVEPRENVLSMSKYLCRDPHDTALMDVLPMLLALDRDADVRKRLPVFDRKLRMQGL